MKVVISRTYGKFETRGSLYVLNGEEMPYRCKTIELPNLGNQRSVSCIPEGIYDCFKTIRANGNPAIAVKNVPGRDNILIHSGNYVSGKGNPKTGKPDSEGCILPGTFFSDMNADGYIDVCESKRAMSNLLSFLPDEFKLYVI